MPALQHSRPKLRSQAYEVHEDDTAFHQDAIKACLNAIKEKQGMTKPEQALALIDLAVQLLDDEAKARDSDRLVDALAYLNDDVIPNIRIVIKEAA